MNRISLLITLLIMSGGAAFSQDRQKAIRMEAVRDFPQLNREGMASNRRSYAPYHVEEDLNALAGDDLKYTFHIAAAEGTFPGKTGTYRVRLNTLTERDGECVYQVYVNDQPVGQFRQNPPTNEFTAPAMLRWDPVVIPERARIRVESNNWSNLLRHEENFFEYARGRWTSVDFIPAESMDSPVADDTETGIFEKAVQIGPAERPVEARYEAVENAYYLTGEGVNEKGSIDRFGFLGKNVPVDFTLETLLTPLSFNNSEKYETGIMIRPMEASYATYVACILRGDGLVSVKYREMAGGGLQEIIFSVRDADMFQIEKKGSTFTMSAARFGEEYERHSIDLSGLSGSLKAGFFISSNQPGQRELVRFSRVRYFEDHSGEIER